MQRSSRLLPERMLRVTVVAPDEQMRRVLVEVAASGLFEPDPPRDHGEGQHGNLMIQTLNGAEPPSPELSINPVSLKDLQDPDMLPLLVGEASMEKQLTSTVPVGRCSTLPGWVPNVGVDELRHRIAPLGGAIAEIPLRPGIVVPTAFAQGSVSTELRPLVTTYTTVPYQDIDPTILFSGVYMVMFGMMFGDVGHGLILMVLGFLALHFGADHLPAARAAAPFLIGAGITASAFGLLYGEAFGPTDLVPTLWLRPLEKPETLLLAGLVVGTILLAITFALATVNRWREGGIGLALYDASGIGGSFLFAGLMSLAIGNVSSTPWLFNLGLGMSTIGFVLTFIGLFSKAGITSAGFGQALVEIFDTVLRLGSNIVSFTRLAAFGLTHAVLTGVTWDGTTSLWNRSGLLVRVAAMALFVVGNAVAFGLGALVGAVQALRLEYYELFSRLFLTQGRPFLPWHIPLERLETQ